MSNGFLYVLMNPSMPGLVKVGKTTRDPATRVYELSAATGVPTSFVLLYSQPVADCHAAEAWVHAELERRGHRPNASREFFTAPAHEAVDVVHAAKSISDQQTTHMTVQQVQGAPSQSNLESAEALFQEGELYRNGSNDVLIDGARAAKLYELAAAMDHSEAAYQAGMLFATGAGVRRNPVKAVTLHMKAAGLGFWRSHAALAVIFESTGQVHSATRRWQQLFEAASIEIPKGSPHQIERDMAVMAEESYCYCKRVAYSAFMAQRPQAEVSVRGEVPPAQLAAYRDGLLAFSEPHEEEWRRSGRTSSSSLVHKYLLDQLALADATTAGDEPVLNPRSCERP